MRYLYDSFITHLNTIKYALNITLYYILFRIITFNSFFGLSYKYIYIFSTNYKSNNIFTIE